MKKLIVLLLVLTMMLTLAGCKKDDYESAVALMDAGSYAEAIVAFTELGDYEDSAQRLEECKNITTYAEATALFEAENYEEALKLFTALGNYEDSAEKCVECQNAITYNEAVALFEEGAYFEAKAVFETIPDYRDVAEYLARYQIVELNTENWQEYFELILTEDWVKDDFDEVVSLRLFYNIQSKDTYAGCILDVDGQEIKLGYSFAPVAYRGTVDLSNRVYTVESELDGGRDSKKIDKGGIRF